MDFLDPKKKRAHKRRLFLGYALMGMILIMGTYFVAIRVNGFYVDPRTGKVVQNGLVFVDAHPESATVYIDGVQKTQTDTRLDLPAGIHTLELKRNGYRTWKRQFDLVGSSIERFSYPFLFPEKLVTKDLKQYDTAPGLVTESPDRHWLLAQQPGDLTSFDVIDLNAKTNPVTTIVLPTTLFTAKEGIHNLELVEWSTDNRHVLVKHSFVGGSEFVIIDKDTPASSVNLNQYFQIPITSISLRDKRFDQYYLYDANGGVLRQADIKNKQLTPILTHVLAYKSYGADVILYVTEEGQPAGKAIAKLLDKETQYSLRLLPISPLYLVNLTQFNGTWYMAVGDSAEQKAYVYKDPFTALKAIPAKTPLPLSVLKVQSIEYATFSQNARFIAVQGGSEFAVYDAENNDQYRYDIKLNLPAHLKAEWMDGHRLVVNSDGKTVVFDFDGMNQQTLNDALPQYSVFFNREYNAMFSVITSKSVSKPALTRTELLANPPQ